MNVFVSKNLKRYPSVYETFTQPPINAGVLNTTNIWLRDFMPVKTSKGCVKFNYKGYGIDILEAYAKYPQLVVDEKLWRKYKPVKTDIILDGGGNCVRVADDKYVITEIVFKHNKNYKRKTLQKGNGIL